MGFTRRPDEGETSPPGAAAREGYGDLLSQQWGCELEPVRLLLADDHTLFRKGVRTLLEQMPDIEVVGEAANGQEVVSRARELVPDVILMDIRVPEINGIEATRFSNK